MSSARSGKVLVSFGAGEYTPDLDSRADLDNAQFAARTLKNFRTDIFGGAVRRAGLQFVAAAKPPADFDTTSWEGSGTIYGITEFGDLSDPPRKYRMLESNYSAALRADANLAPDCLATYLLNRDVYDTGGTRTDVIAGANGCSDGSGLLPNLETASVAAFSAPGNSWESLDYADFSGTDWIPYEPTWTRAKTAKDFDEAQLPASPDESGRRLYRLAQSFGRRGGTQGSSRGAGVREPVWTDGVWRLTIDVAGDGFNGVGFASGVALYARVANGNQDPGTVSIADQFVGTSPQVAGFGGSTTATLTLDVPPNCSVRFLLRRGGEDTQFPQQIEEYYTNGIPADSGLTEGLFNRWLYLPATEAALPAWDYEEALGIEDTLEDGLMRDGGTVGSKSVAETSAATGGVTAESADPIDFTATTVRVAYTFTGLASGNIYAWSVRCVQNTIGISDPVLVDVAGGEFTASGATQPVEFLMIAPLGKQRRAVSFSAVSQGPAPTPPVSYETETLLAYARVLAAGSTWNAAQLTLADDLVVALKALSSFTKIKYLMPFIGPDIAASAIPLIDSANLGVPTVTGFVDADYSQSTGIQGASGKYFMLPFDGSILGTSNNGGGFTWTLALPTPPFTFGFYPFGCYNSDATRLFAIEYRDSGGTQDTGFYWGNASDPARVSGAPSPGFHHGESPSTASRRLYIDGSLVATNTTSSDRSGIGDNTLAVMGRNQPIFGGVFSFEGRSGLFGFTDGSMTDTEASDLRDVLSSFMTATGRI